MTDANFWNRAARGYAKRPISNIPAYEQTLDRVRRHLHSEQTALEVGCGTGSTALLLAPSVAQYTGTDVASEMIEIAQEKRSESPVSGLDFVISDADLSSFDSKSRDVVLGFNLYHLVPDLAAAITSAHRVLKPGGLFITKTPCIARRWYLRPVIKLMQLIGKAPYVAFLAPSTFDDALRNTGFDIVETAIFGKSIDNHFVVAKKRG